MQTAGSLRQVCFAQPAMSSSQTIIKQCSKWLKLSWMLNLHSKTIWWKNGNFRWLHVPTPNDLTSQVLDAWQRKKWRTVTTATRKITFGCASHAAISAVVADNTMAVAATSMLSLTQILATTRSSLNKAQSQPRALLVSSAMNVIRMS